MIPAREENTLISAREESAQAEATEQGGDESVHSIAHNLFQYDTWRHIHTYITLTKTI